MKKRVLLISVIALLQLYCLAQNSNNYRIIYKHCVQIDTARILNDGIGFIATLTGNSIESNYTMNKIYSHINDTTKSIYQRIEDKQKGTFKVMMPGSMADSFGNQVFYNKLKDSIYLREKMNDYYVITKEKTPKIKWNITSDTMSIMGYHCTLAETDFRGRKYTAFFTTDVPIVAGPWKFNGLPGLVLLIQDQKDQVKIYATKIEYPVTDVVQPFSGGGRLINANEYINLRDKDFEKMIRQTEQMVAGQQYFDKTNLSAKIAKKQGIFGIELKTD